MCFTPQVSAGKGHWELGTGHWEALGAGRRGDILLVEQLRRKLSAVLETCVLNHR